MNPIDYVILAIVVLILGGCIYSIYRSKKAGKKCIGCPDSGSCSSNGSTCTGHCDGCICGCGHTK